MQDPNPKRKTFVPNNKIISKNWKFLDNKNAIFKYMPLSTNALKILINSTLWFGEVMFQNDPFEGDFIINNTADIINPPHSAVYDMPSH